MVKYKSSDRLSLEELNKLIMKSRNELTINLDEVISKKEEFDGFLNCSEMGHFNTPGNPFSGLELNKNQWAFDAIYTPAITSFLEKSNKRQTPMVKKQRLYFFFTISRYRHRFSIAMFCWSSRLLELFIQGMPHSPVWT